MDIKSVQTLIAVVDCGSFAEAGLKLNISPSSVSVQIRNLESDVGKILFDRTTRPPTLSAEGRQFVERAREVMRCWAELHSEFPIDASRGILKIGAVPSALSGCLPAAIKKHTTEHPALDVRLVSGYTHELEAKIRVGQIDAAVTVEPENPDPEIVFSFLTDEPLVVVAAGQLKGKTWRQVLLSNPFIQFNRHVTDARRINTELARANIHVTSRYEIDTLDAVVSLVHEGLGAAIIPLNKGGNRLPDGIECFPFGSPPIVRRIGVLSSPVSVKMHLVEPFIENMRAFYEAAPKANDAPARFAS